MIGALGDDSVRCQRAIDLAIRAKLSTLAAGAGRGAADRAQWVSRPGER